jgi:ribosomal protein S6
MTETVKTAGTVYEVGFHIVPAVSPENLPKEVDAIKAFLGKQGATIISEEFPKLRSLAYSMVKVVGQTRQTYETAYFGWIKFEAAKENAAEIAKHFETSEKVLRHLLIKTVRESTLYGSKVLSQEKGAKEDAPKEASKEVKAPVAAAEDLDKSIEKLVV